MTSNNNDMISRAAVIRAIRNHINVNRERADRGYAAMIREEDIKIIEGVPSAERIGEWIPAMKELHIGTVQGRMCSECEATFVGRAIYGNNYCPKCGARMEKVGDSDEK